MNTRNNYRNLLSFLLITIISMTTQGSVFGQGRAAPQQVVTSVNNLDQYQKFIYDGNSVVPKTEMRGSNYLHEDFQQATLLMAGDTVIVPNVNVRVDLVNRVLEVEQEGKTKIFPSFLVKTATLQTTKEVITPRKFVGKDGPPGFFGVLYDGPSALYLHYSTTIKQSNYNPALDAGRTWDEILVVETYYMRLNGELVKLEKKKSKRLAQLGGERVSDFVEENDIDIRNDEGLVRVLRYIDQENQ